MIRFARVLSGALCAIFIAGTLLSLIPAIQGRFSSAFGFGAAAYGAYRAYRGLRPDSDARAIRRAWLTSLGFAVPFASAAVFSLWLGFDWHAPLILALAAVALCFTIIAIAVRARRHELEAAALRAPSNLSHPGLSPLAAELRARIQAKLAVSEMLGDRGTPPPTPPESTEPAATKPALYLSRTGLPVPLDHPARSYFGGLPRLPPTLSWPLRTDGEYTSAQTFIAQIDLEEIADQGPFELPPRGTLYYFFSAGIDCIEDDDTQAVQVLYYDKRADTLPLSSPPSALDVQSYTLHWPWLSSTDNENRIAFKFPISFQRFISVCDYAGIGRELAFERMDKQLRTRLPVSNEAIPRAWDELTETSTVWPFNWSVIVHASRSAIHTMDDLQRYPRLQSSESAKDGLTRLRARAMSWLERASAEEPLSACDATTAASFREHWQALHGELERVAKEAGIAHPQPLREPLFRALELACYLAAASQQEAQRRLIPEAYRAALENQARWQTGSEAQHRVARHQMLGFGLSVQDAPASYADEVLLLQVSGDDLSWLPGFGCVLQLWIAPNALAAGSFDQVHATLECD